MRIRTCMGSSCFARGNGHTTKLLQEYLQARGLAGQIELSGALCEEHCSSGPNLEIDGELYHGVTASSLASILDRHVGIPASRGAEPK